eukprot:scaffold1157_cov122-Cylindrotheca_fusiformis.AAC.2
MSDDKIGKIEAVEEAPWLRSVKFGSLSQPLPSPSAPFALPPKLGHLQRPSFGVKQSFSPAVSSSINNTNWVVDDFLPSIPSNYRLERSNVYVNNCTPSQVASRIMNSLNSHSIATTILETEKVSSSYRLSQLSACTARRNTPSHWPSSFTFQNSVQAESMQGLRFLVNLFASSDGDENTIIVEVQRLRGCAVQFRQICRDICRSAKGGLANAAPRNRKFAIPSCIPRSSMMEKESRYRGAVESAINMIKSERIDSQLLGLESLEKLSRNEATISMLFSSENLGMLMAYSVPASGYQGYHESLRRRLALAILANALEICRTIPVQLSSDSFVQQLQSYLGMANEAPHEFLLATKCLQALQTSRD